jgi:hypothetical protein
LIEVFKSDKYTGKIISEYNKSEILEKFNRISEFSDNSEIIYKVRNQIFKLPVINDGKKITFCVKQFPKFNFINCIQYKKTGSKAKRAFEAACFLKENSVGVPEPVAYIERWQGIILKESYYIDIFEENISSFKREMIDLLRNEKDCEKFLNLLHPVAVELKKMHNAGFQHNDSGYQNIMIRRKNEKEWDNVKFIDLNRGKIKRQLSLKEKAYDVAKLEIPSDFLRIFLYIYFDNNPIPEDFSKHEEKYRRQITFHNESRKYRHPFRYLKNRHIKEDESNIRPHYKDMWLWDNRSGQPAVMLSGKDRKKYRKKTDILRIIFANIKYGLKIYRNYNKLKNQIYKQKLEIYQKIGITIEVDDHINERLNLLYELPVKSVFIRVYIHKGKKHWDKVCDIVKKLFEKEYEVSIGLIQDRDSVKYPQKFMFFAGFILQRVFPYIKYCEIAHAVNRVKWGIWDLREYKRLILPLAELTQRYNEVRFIIPGVNDFEYPFSVFCLDIAKDKLKAYGNSCHLYVDRRGAPENYQGRFSLIEKCILGKAVSCEFFKENPEFLITEINWPLKGKGVYSPIGCPYVAPGITENPIHVDEEEYAQYMIRTYLISLCSGMTERVWWWRLCAKGYGLVNDIDGFKPYTAYYALKFFLETVRNKKFLSFNCHNNINEYIFDGMKIKYSTDKDFNVETGNIYNIFGELKNKDSVMEKNRIYYLFD